MTQATIRPGTIDEVYATGEGPSSALFVAQQPGDPGGWTLDLRAETPLGVALVRRVVLPPLAKVSQSARLVALESVPGAVRWVATVRSPRPAPTTSLIVALIAGAEGLESTLGRTRQQDPGGIGYEHDVASADGTTNVPPGARVLAVSAVDDGSGTGTVTIGTLGAIPMQANQVLYLPAAELEGLVGPVDIAFTNVAQRFVAWRF